MPAVRRRLLALAQTLLWSGIASMIAGVAVDIACTALFVPGTESSNIVASIEDVPLALMWSTLIGGVDTATAARAWSDRWDSWLMGAVVAGLTVATPWMLVRWRRAWWSVAIATLIAGPLCVVWVLMWLITLASLALGARSVSGEYLLEGGVLFGGVSLLWLGIVVELIDFRSVRRKADELQADLAAEGGGRDARLRPYERAARAGDDPPG